MNQTNLYFLCLEAHFMALSIFVTLYSLKPCPFFIICQSLYPHDKKLLQVCWFLAKFLRLRTQTDLYTKIKYSINAINTCGLYTFNPIFDCQNIYLRRLFRKILTLYIFKSGFIIKSGLWWRVYSVHSAHWMTLYKITLTSWEMSLTTSTTEHHF